MVNNYDWMKEYSFLGIYKRYRKAYNSELHDVERFGKKENWIRI